MELTPGQQQLVELAARVPAADVPTARRVLQALIVDPLWLSLQTAPLDDEELTAEDIASIEESQASFARGEAIPHEEIMREFGLKSEG
jgi:hypothetical protein